MILRSVLLALLMAVLSGARAQSTYSIALLKYNGGGDWYARRSGAQRVGNALGFGGVGSRGGQAMCVDVS